MSVCFFSAVPPAPTQEKHQSLGLGHEHWPLHPSLPHLPSQVETFLSGPALGRREGRNEDEVEVAESPAPVPPGQLHWEPVVSEGLGRAAKVGANASCNPPLPQAHLSPHSPQWSLFCSPSSATSLGKRA